MAIQVFAHFFLFGCSCFLFIDCKTFCMSTINIFYIMQIFFQFPLPSLVSYLLVMQKCLLGISVFFFMASGFSEDQPTSSIVFLSSDSPQTPSGSGGQLRGVERQNRGATLGPSHVLAGDSAFDVESFLSFQVSSPPPGYNKTRI